MSGFAGSGETAQSSWRTARTNGRKSHRPVVVSPFWQPDHSELVKGTGFSKVSDICARLVDLQSYKTRGRRGGDIHDETCCEWDLMS